MSHRKLLWGSRPRPLRPALPHSTNSLVLPEAEDRGAAVQRRERSRDVPRVALLSTSRMVRSSLKLMDAFDHQCVSFFSECR